MSDRFFVHEATLDAERALRILRGQELHGFSVARFLGGLRPDHLRGLDLVFVPHWYCSFRVSLERGSGRSSTAQPEHAASVLWAMVDALAGHVLRLPGEPPLVERDLAGLAPAVAVPAALGRDEATTRAIDGLRWDLRVRGRQRVAPRRIDPLEARLGHVPFWVGYFLGPDGQMRARAVHGVEGSIQGETFMQALLCALEAVA